MYDRVDGGAKHGEQRCPFCEPVDARAKIVAADHQNCCKQAGSVGNADPPDIIDEVQPPDIGYACTPYPDADDDRQTRT